MAYYYPEPSHTFSEYLLVPGYTSEDCIPDKVSLKTPLVRYRCDTRVPTSVQTCWTYSIRSARPSRTLSAGRYSISARTRPIVTSASSCRAKELRGSSSRSACSTAARP